MTSVLAYLKEFNFVSMVFRLILALTCGAVIGLGRSQKKQNAGLRTYMLTAIGAALSVLLTCYEYEMMTGQWASIVDIVGMKFDASRYSAQVISGIGFLAAGTILSSGHQQVTGLTTAAGLFASVCMGMAAGAGMYDCVIMVLVILIIVLDVMYPLEGAFKRRLRNMTIYVEFASIEDLDNITDTIKGESATIYDIDVERTRREGNKYPAAVIVLQMGRGNASHSSMLSTVAELPCVHTIHELIA
ncbi:MAG TPA: Mg2+ transporter-C family protein [Lachnospiraceae bacterium]|nr:Mg2+ transporter-C family protein [Lachnospiraceae bacterium]